MAGYDGRGARFPLTIVRGADLAFQLTVTTGGSAVDLSASTIAGEVYSTSGTLVDTMTAAVSGAGSNVVTLSFTDTETTALTATRYAWTLWVTRGGDKRPWLAGQVNVTDGTQGQSGSTGAYALTVDEDLAVAVDVAAVGGSGGGATNLTWTAATSTVASDTGTDAVLTAVDGSNPGLMTVALKTKLDAIEALADVTDAANVAAAGAVMLSTAPVTVSGTTDTLASTDNGKVNIYSNAALVTITLPTDASDDLPDGFECLLVASGAAGLTLSTAGLTLVGSAPSTTAAQDESIYVKKTSTANTWLVIGPAAGGGGGATNLTWTAATSTVASDTGTDAVLTVADGTNPGLMSAAHYTKLNTIDADITTLSLPASTTISAFGATLVDDADAATARTTIGAVGLTGDETVAGVKTFSSDPLIPDEVYGVGWNGSLEPPTKNAVYDKIETLGGSGTIRVEDEGSSVVAAATALNFAGTGVTVTDAGSNEALVTITSGGTDVGVVTAATCGLIRTF